MAADDNVVLRKAAHELRAQLRPPWPVKLLRHNFKNDDVVVLGIALIAPAPFSRGREKLVTPPKRSVSFRASSS